MQPKVYATVNTNTSATTLPQSGSCYGGPSTPNYAAPAVRFCFTLLCCLFVCARRCLLCSSLRPSFSCVLVCSASDLDAFKYVRCLCVSRRAHSHLILTAAPVRALRRYYCNVHSTVATGGEVRGQVIPATNVSPRFGCSRLVCRA